MGHLFSGLICIRGTSIPLVAESKVQIIVPAQVIIYIPLSFVHQAIRSSWRLPAAQSVFEMLESKLQAAALATHHPVHHLARALRDFGRVAEGPLDAHVGLCQWRE